MAETEKSLIKISNPDHVTVMQTLPDTYHLLRNNQNIQDRNNVLKVCKLASTLLKMPDANAIFKEVDDTYWNALIVHNSLSGKTESRSANTPDQQRRRLEKAIAQALKNEGVNLYYHNHVPNILSPRIHKENAVIWE